MKQPPTLPTDDAIEHGLSRRASHGPDSRLLAAVMADVAVTRQVVRWGPTVGSSGASGHRRAVLLAVAAAIAIVGAAALAGGFGSRPTLVVVTDVSPSPVLTARPTTSFGPAAIAKAEPCSSDDVVAAADPTGSVKSTGMSFDGLGKGRMAYLTRTQVGDGDEVDVWSATHGATVATRIATFVGPVLDLGRVGDLTPGVADLLVSVGHMSATDNPSCSDLYLLASDGALIRRLTHDPIGTEIGASRLSPDGSQVAFVSIMTHTPGAPAGPYSSIEVTSVSDGKDQQVFTGPCADPVWSPDSQEVAVRCSPSDTTSTDYIEIWDRSTGAWSAIDAPTGAVADAIAWMANSRSLIAVTSDRPDGAAMVDGRSLSIEDIDLAHRTWTVEERAAAGLAADGTGAQFVLDPGPSISPDRAFALLDMYDDKGGFLASLDMKTGRMTRLTDPSVVRSSRPWSLDSSRVIVEGAPPKSCCAGLGAVSMDGVRVSVATLPAVFPDDTVPYAVELP